MLNSPGSMEVEFAPARDVRSPEGLFFYHSIEVPEFGLIEGHWDLRSDVHAYLGAVDFHGTRCLDVGAGTGFLTFAMEDLGAADIVSFDIRNGSDWDVVPHYMIRDEMAEIRRRQDVTVEQMKDAYWLCHRLLRSRAKAFYGDLYDLPDGLGEFDVVFFGMILTHLRDPFLALLQRCPPEQGCRGGHGNMGRRRPTDIDVPSGRRQVRKPRREELVVALSRHGGEHARRARVRGRHDRHVKCHGQRPGQRGAAIVRSDRRPTGGSVITADNRPSCRVSMLWVSSRRDVVFTVAAACVRAAEAMRSCPSGER